MSKEQSGQLCQFVAAQIKLQMSALSYFYVPSTYLLDVMTETLAMLALLPTFVHCRAAMPQLLPCYATVALPLARHSCDHPEAGEARKLLSLSSAAVKTLAKLSCVRFRAQLLNTELLAYMD